MKYANTSRRRARRGRRLIPIAGLLASSLLGVAGCGHKSRAAAVPDPLTAARAFSFDYAKWRSGDLRPAQIRAADAQLIARLSRQRVPLGSPDGSLSVVDIRLVRKRPGDAVAQLTLRSSPEQLSFTSTLRLRANGTAWSVTSLR